MDILNLSTTINYNKISITNKPTVGETWNYRKYLICPKKAGKENKRFKSKKDKQNTDRKILNLTLIILMTATHSSTLAWEIPWMEEPGRLQCMGSHRVRHN